jgi:Protein of unknown function (DUF3501)
MTTANPPDYLEPVSRDTLWTLEKYSKLRPAFRNAVIAHKKLRTVALGNHITLLFEDTLTVRYQIQEMLRIEKTFEDEGIQDELDAYLPLLPTGSNFKATMMIEYPVVEERIAALKRLRDIEHKVYVQVEGAGKVYAIADEDLPRSNEEKTSAVHFMRFELTEDMVKALKYGVTLAVGIDHAAYEQHKELAVDVRNSLVADLT